MKYKIINFTSSFLVFANAIDTILTLWFVIIKSFYQEANPLMNLLIANSIFLFILIKILLIPLLIMFLQHHSYFSKLAQICLYVTTFLYVSLICWWLYVLF